MSTFKGIFKEDVFRGCVADYFQDDALKEAKAFFLSHFHTDHMNGLEDVKFQQLLEKDPTIRLYCSSITRKMLLKRRSFMGLPGDKIVALGRHPIVIVPVDTAIRVTPLRAGHCPGSLMFLFEADDVSALYTGDFRLSEKDLAMCKPLHDPDTGKVIKIHSLYLDTTFADSDYEHFPPRERSKDNIVEIIRRRRKDFKYFVIEPTAKTGNEYLMAEIFNEFKTRIHASYNLCQDILSCIDQLRDVTTCDLRQSFVHFCCTKDCHPCPKVDPTMSQDILIVKPSAMYFTRYVLESMGEVVPESDNRLKVAYSSHASLSELASFVAYLNPVSIYPSVVDKSMSDRDVLLEIYSYISLNS